MASEKVFTFGDDNFDTEVLQAELPASPILQQTAAKKRRW